MNERNRVPLIYSRKDHMICYMNYKRQVYVTKEEKFNFEIIKIYKYHLHEILTDNEDYIIYSPLMTIINKDIFKDLARRTIYNKDQFINISRSYEFATFRGKNEISGADLINVINDDDTSKIPDKIIRYLQDEAYEYILDNTIKRFTNGCNINTFLEIFTTNLQSMIDTNWVMQLYGIRRTKNDHLVYYDETDQVSRILNENSEISISRVTSNIVYTEDGLSIKYITVSIDLCESIKEQAIKTVQKYKRYLLGKVLDACEDPVTKGYVKKTKLSLSALNFDTVVVTNDCRFVVTLSTKAKLK